MRSISTWRELAHAYGQRLMRRGATAATIDIEMRALRGFVRFLAERRCEVVSRINPAHLTAFVAELFRRRVSNGLRAGQLWSPASVLTWTNVVRRFLRWVARSEHTLLDWSVWLPRLNAPHTLPRVLSPAQVRRLMAAPAEQSPADQRDRAVLELLYASGLRVGELVALDLADVNLLDGEVHVRCGKGRRERRVPIGQPAMRALGVYLRRGRDTQSIRSATVPCPAVFLSARGTRFGIQGIELMLHRRARQARIDGRVTPHVLRHTAAVHLLRCGADVRYIQEFLGHTCVGTTARYTRLDPSDLRQAIARSHPRARLGPLTSR